jgi:hypothetical protein
MGVAIKAARIIAITGALVLALVVLGEAATDLAGTISCDIFAVL